MADTPARQLQAAIQAAAQHAVDQLSDKFNAEIDQLRAEYTTALSAITTELSQQRPVIPDPLRLKDPTGFDAWLLAIEGKLRVDGKALGSPEAQFYYVYDRLEPDIQNLVIPQVAHAKATQIWDHHIILDTLARLCEIDSKGVRTACRLRTLRMKEDESFEMFFDLWEDLSEHACSDSQPDGIRIQELRHALPDSLQKKLEDYDTPIDYVDFVDTTGTRVGAWILDCTVSWCSIQRMTTDTRSIIHA